MDRLKKTQGSRKLKPQENNSKLKQKTQGFGKILKDNYKFWPNLRGKYTLMGVTWLKYPISNWNNAKIVKS